MLVDDCFSDSFFTHSFIALFDRKIYVIIAVTGNYALALRRICFKEKTYFHLSKNEADDVGDGTSGHSSM